MKASEFWSLVSDFEDCARAMEMKGAAGPEEARMIESEYRQSKLTLRLAVEQQFKNKEAK